MALRAVLRARSSQISRDSRAFFFFFFPPFHSNFPARNYVNSNSTISPMTLIKKKKIILPSSYESHPRYTTSNFFFYRGKT